MIGGGGDPTELHIVHPKNYMSLIFCTQKRGSYRGMPVMRDWLILFSVKREFNEIILRDP